MSRSIRFACTWSLRVLLVSLMVGTCAGVALAQAPTDVVRVEEQWDMVVGQPDTASDAPQVTCVITPFANISSWYTTFELNHQNLPSFVPGGLQLQVWEGGVPISQRKFPNDALLNRSGEPITWTQAMEVASGSLIFEVTEGTSTTWGNFGGQGYLKAVMDAPCANLNAYSPDVSVRHSGVSFGGNRVQSLVLRKVRVTLANGQQTEDATPRVVHQMSE